MSDEPEDWRPVVGYEGLYEVSSLGRVRSLDRVVRQTSRWGGIVVRKLRGAIIGRVGAEGYPIVSLCDARGQRSANVHSLVCTAFHGQPPLGAEAAHSDGIRSNCAATNLRWASPVENRADSLRHGTAPMGATHGGAKLTEEEVIEIRRSRDNVRMTAARYGVSAATVSMIRNRRIWRHLA